jgi:hypothetical protein
MPRTHLERTVEYIRPLTRETGTLANISIFPGQHQYYSIQVPAARKNETLAVAIRQNPTEKGTFLSLVAMQAHRCPTKPPYGELINTKHF